MAESWRALLAADARRYRAYAQHRFGYRPTSWFADPGFLCVLLHRITHALHQRGFRKLSWWTKQLNSIVTGADIEPASEFGPGLLIPHPVGVTLSTRAGSNLTVGARAGCGGSVQSEDVGAGPGLPVLGDGIRLGDHCGQQGGIHIGDGAVVESGAGALVDIPAGGRGVLASEPTSNSVPVCEEQPPILVPDCPHKHWRRCWADWKVDLDRICSELERYDGRPTAKLRRIVAAATNSLLALLVYRFSHWLHINGWHGSARAAAATNLLVHKLAITPRTCLGGGVLMPHLSGVVIDGVIGEGATIYANCVIAGLRTERPIAGDHLTLGGHAGLIGPIRAGDGVRLAPKVQLTSNAPAGAQAYSPMSRVKRLGPGEYVPPTPHRHVRPPQEDPWKEWRRCRRSDRERLRKCFPAAPFAARSSVALFRLSCALRQSGYRRASRWLWRANMYLTGSDLASDSVIGAGLVVPYPAGISLFATTGENLTLHAQTMLVPEVDAPGARDRANAPTLGSDVTLEPHSGVCGPSTVGDNVTIRPGCVVRFAVESGRTVSPKPLRLRVAPVAAASPKR